MPDLHPKAHPELVAFVAETETPSLATKTDVHFEITPAFAMVAKAKAQAAKYRALLTMSELAPHDHRLDTKFEHMHQTLDALDREATLAGTALRNLATVFTQWERYARQLPEQISATLAADEKAR